MKIEQIAAICHEANRALCIYFGDLSQEHWENAPDWQRESAIHGVEFQRDNPTAPASASHANWFSEKLRDGWKYGPIKSTNRKEHPYMVPFDELPPHQQAKDHLFKSICAALLPFLDK